MIEPVLAGIALLVCAALLLRMLLPEARRRRVDAQCHRCVHHIRGLAHRLWFWRAYRQRAAREAEEAIRRAQRTHQRDGNVIRPDAFKRPQKPH